MYLVSEAMDNWRMDEEAVDSHQFADALVYMVGSESVDALAGTLACDRFQLSLLQKKSTKMKKNSPKRTMIHERTRWKRHWRCRWRNITVHCNRFNRHFAGDVNEVGRIQWQTMSEFTEMFPIDGHLEAIALSQN